MNAPIRVALALAGALAVCSLACDTPPVTDDGGSGGSGGNGGSGGSGGGSGGGTGGGSGGGTGGGAGGGSGGGSGGGGAGGGTGGAGGGSAINLDDAGFTGPDGGIWLGMTFFVTSRGMGNGGDLRGDAGDGLTGADNFCRGLALAVDARFGGRTWKAYLSTTTVNARTRIGTGPWVNSRGVTVATSVANLHDEVGTNALSLANSLDEYGVQVPAAGTVLHDILTGSTQDGGAAGTAHCSDWTSNGGGVIARVGHSNRGGGGQFPTSWNSAHASGGCAENGANSVKSGGGRGSIYCFGQ